MGKQIFSLRHEIKCGRSPPFGASWVPGAVLAAPRHLCPTGWWCWKVPEGRPDLGAWLPQPGGAASFFNVVSFLIKTILIPFYILGFLPSMGGI